MMSSRRWSMNWPWLTTIGLLPTGVLGAALNSPAEPDAQKDAEEARRILRQRGFKTDLSDFDFSVDQETEIRAAALTNIASIRPIILLQPFGTECALVAWKQAGLGEED